jgi:hypothetical protein
MNTYIYAYIYIYIHAHIHMCIRTHTRAVVRTDEIRGLLHFTDIHTQAARSFCHRVSVCLSTHSSSKNTNNTHTHARTLGHHRPASIRTYIHTKMSDSQCLHHRTSPPSWCPCGRRHTLTPLCTCSSHVTRTPKVRQRCAALSHPNIPVVSSSHACMYVCMYVHRAEPSGAR